MRLWLLPLRLLFEWFGFGLKIITDAEIFIHQRRVHELDPCNRIRNDPGLTTMLEVEGFSGSRARRRRRCTMEIEGSEEEEDAVVKEVYGGCGGAGECGVLGDWV
ncbi:hypothetical protein CMV_013114 [Castanea mollissima]|uniref:Uncharacterized protein n=1 Tax=Castanea mollissima TaxID=60419 RepID=A0A8J4QYQ7_9ROSI|nr:hypothetical protein CMV_013114 [Castanea mollissima]